MKHRQWKQFLSLILVVCMVFTMAMPSLAGPINTEKDRNFFKRWNDYLQSLLEKLEDQFTDNEEEEEIPEEPSDESTTSVELTVVEDESTVVNANMLRASTFTMRNSGVDALAESTVKYFPITLFDYDAATINDATHALEAATAQTNGYWNGMYFNNGNPGEESYTYTTQAGAHADLTWEQVKNGIYYVDEACTRPVTVSPVTDANGGSTEVSGLTFGALYEEAGKPQAGQYAETVYMYEGKKVYICSSGGVYYIGIDYNDGWANDIEKGAYTDVISSTLTTSGTVVGYIATAGGNTIATLDSTDITTAFGLTLYTKAGTNTTGYLPYALHNVWTDFIAGKNVSGGNFGKLERSSGNTGNKGYVYTGLVENTLGANKNIQFTVPDAGLFNDDTSIKHIYTNVGLPFEYDSSTQMYTFDSDTKSAKFDSNPVSNATLVTAAVGSFAPFNNSGNGSSVDLNDDEKHFGMTATVPFNMTTNGILNNTPITFAFSGDDDVWVFIDGILVLDIGGIHDRADGYLNFSDTATEINGRTAPGNRSIVFSNNSQNRTGYMNPEAGAVEASDGISAQLFNEYDENGELVSEGLLKQSRESFAARANHELTIFYLERGGGKSNNQLKFNLPVRDSVTVTKQIAGEAVVVENGSTYNLSELSMTDEQIRVLRNLDFTFVLYKNDQPVKNATFIKMNSNGQVLETVMTDTNGEFTLKHGQTAKFIDEFAVSTNDTYKVVEKIRNGFIYTDFKYSMVSAGTNEVNNADAGTHKYAEDVTVSGQETAVNYITDMEYNGGLLASDGIRVTGGIESEDSVSFIASNYVNASLPTPSALPGDDTIVIDYGLPVEIDLDANDYFVGTGYTIAISTPETDCDFGTYAFDSQNNVLTYSLNKQMTGIEVIEYTMTARYADGSNVTYSQPETAKIYIIPATVMYYEENFSDFVTYTGIGWQNDLITESVYINALQEPGVVGTHGDSPYGSDVAYLNDSHDSNGTSKYAVTTGGAVQFSYTFTGTGTSFFGRTTENSGYMRVVVTDESETKIQSIYRDTVYLNANGLKVDTLYNIPIYTIDELDYGTYTVTTTIAKSTEANGYGSDFWLDGIRIYQPLNSSDPNKAIADSAYATDAEANMVNVTLRNKLIREADLDENGNPTTENGNFAVITDNTGEITTLEQYISDGPKEEVYLYDGQSVTFSLDNWDPDTNKLYLGMKAPTGSAAVQVNRNAITLNNAADCYYEVSSYATVTTAGNKKTATFTITAGEGSLVSVTNIKVTGNAEFDIIQENTDIDIDGAEGEGEDPVAEING